MKVIEELWKHDDITNVKNDCQQLHDAVVVKVAEASSILEFMSEEDYRSPKRASHTEEEKKESSPGVSRRRGPVRSTLTLSLAKVQSRLDDKEAESHPVPDIPAMGHPVRLKLFKFKPMEFPAFSGKRRD